MCLFFSQRRRFAAAEDWSNGPLAVVTSLSLILPLSTSVFSLLRNLLTNFLAAFDERRRLRITASSARSTACAADVVDDVVLNASL